MLYINKKGKRKKNVEVHKSNLTLKENSLYYTSNETLQYFRTYNLFYFSKKTCNSNHKAVSLDGLGMIPKFFFFKGFKCRY